ncbi:N-acetylmuramic acid 6-phosphate etherase family protein [Pseudoxanthomonas sangjuensis]|uniref:hypothetical protein n=1 Tax=Pseudoxanthomonas sangjuensis TaxID=1503750 RepID=UPI001390B36B|nr:hypothetical protein [Pseudoxanthomonas sangjuensis]
MSRFRKLKYGALFLSLLAGIAHARGGNDDVLKLLGISPSEQSRDYVRNKQQFQLHTLLTEQRHPQTMDLSRRIAGDTTAGLQALFAVDRDVVATMDAVAADPARLRKLQEASQAMQDALRSGHRVYFYGTGSTGRLAETLESGLWRPFWLRVARTDAWERIRKAYPGIEDRVRGEITGGDRALISSLEGFEDLQLIGRLQLHDNGIGKDDVVFAVTEGGETSAVIGTAKEGAEINGNDPRKTWFVYNNPDEVLLPFVRSREAIEHPGISKIKLPTGPQSITGSTRMQATTTSLYALGVAMEDAIHALLRPLLSKQELRDLGFDEKADIASRLRDFAALQETVADAAPLLAPWTDLESSTYASGHHATYLVQRALMPVFVDVTERAPTFRLAPLDRVDATERRSWIQVWTPAKDADSAWNALLHRPFHGLDPALYAKPFEEQIDDPWLRNAAARGLANAGAEQQRLYDLSLSADNLQRFGPSRGDHGAMILLGAESPRELGRDWLRRFADGGASLGIVHVGDAPLPAGELVALRRDVPRLQVFDLALPLRHDPLELNRTIALKMLLNAHSTGIMAKLGRVVGNTMTAVQPGNLKLYGRATFLIQSHVNAVLASGKWQEANGGHAPLDYADANAVMFDAVDWRHDNAAQATAPEVELSIVRILESLRLQRGISWGEANALLQQRKLDDYLADYDD